MQNKILLKGSSGIKIYFYTNSKGVKIVRKEAVRKEQFLRLKTQYQKHLFLLNQKNALFHIPKIVNKGYKNGNFFYEYKYVKGTSMVEHLINQPLEKLIFILDKLVSIIKYFSTQNKHFENSYENKTFKDSLKEKILNIYNKEGLNEKFKEELLTRLETLSMPQNKTLSHGDLSFDNIIIDKENNIWLIDYIGTFYPHYWLDIAKLFQDIEGKWYELKYGITIDKNKVNKLTKYFKRRINTLDRNYLKNHTFLMSIIFLRILPYLKDESKKNKVLKKIKDYLEKDIV